jgi:serine protease Do
VVEVREGSAAAEADLHPGDVIQRFNRQPVKTPADLQTAVTKLQAGERFSLVVRRDNARVLLTGTL